MMTQFYAGIGTTATFVGYVKDGVVYSTDASGQQIAVGVTSKVHEDLKADYDGVYSRCQEYYDRLVKLGEITPELTGDALIKAQADELAKATQLINQMSQNQKQLLSVIQSMTAGQKIIEEGKHHESAAADREYDPGHLPAVEANDSGIQSGARPVSKHKAGSAKGNNRQKSAS